MSEKDTLLNINKSENETDVEKKRQINTASGISYVLCVTSIVIGAAYMKSCEIDVPAFLIVSGAINFAPCVIVLALAIWSNPENTEERKLDWPFKVFAQFEIVVCLVVTIWGSVIVFGNYSDVSYTRGRAIYCDETPYKFAFVILILNWIWIPISMCGI